MSPPLFPRSTSHNPRAGLRCGYAVSIRSNDGPKIRFWYFVTKAGHHNNRMGRGGHKRTYFSCAIEGIRLILKVYLNNKICNLPILGKYSRYLPFRVYNLISTFRRRSEDISSRFTRGGHGAKNWERKLAHRLGRPPAKRDLTLRTDRHSSRCQRTNP